MVFSSLPVYLDQSNLHQKPYNQQESGVENHRISTHLPPPPPPSQVAGGGRQGSTRPASMVDRARLARIPIPENGLKCPRCDSTSTKFCYFNNYNLMQPRHFCKACRRYWTRGGAMRNVPVGGNCRGSKRSKGGGSRSGRGTAIPEKESDVVDTTGGGNPSSAGGACPTGSGSVGIPGNISQPPTYELPLVNAFHQAGLSYYVDNIGGGGGLSVGSRFQTPQLVSPIGNGGFGNVNSNSFIFTGDGEPWRFMDSLAGFEPAPSTNLDPFQAEGSGKMEESQGLNNINSTRPFLGSMGNNQYWLSSHFN
ncbi:unnamed protein product [Cuscuta epithymum]|uniref:Dof zinc finger protein n=1 Tax=Cuscuta epithymum TaxID=186058 RepID=A0AAV0DTG7_9ASTE|nr:unnamed protein product [Cuscuta epithymum]